MYNYFIRKAIRNTMIENTAASETKTTAIISHDFIVPESG